MTRLTLCTDSECSRCRCAVSYFYRVAKRAEAEDNPKWQKHACRGKYEGRIFDPRGLALGGYTGMLGVLAGLAVGGAFKRYLPLPYPTSMRATALRVLAGNAGLMTTFETVAALTPRRPLYLYTSLRFIKYALVPVYILLIAPALFQRIGI